MPTLCSDLSAADWIIGSDLPWYSLVGFGPSGFSAYARLRFIPDPIYRGQSENEVMLDPNHPVEIDQTRVAVETLIGDESAPVQGYMMIWDGWGDDAFPPSVRGGSQVSIPDEVRIPYRAYYLFDLDLKDFVSGSSQETWQLATDRAMPEPAFIWPANRAWCITADVDPHWAGIGADHRGIERLIAHPGLDIVRIDPNGEEPPSYR